MCVKLAYKRILSSDAAPRFIMIEQHTMDSTPNKTNSLLYHRMAPYIFYLQIPLSGWTKSDLKLLFWIWHFQKWITLNINKYYNTSWNKHIMDNTIDIKGILVIIHPWQTAKILKTYSVVSGKYRFSQHINLLRLLTVDHIMCIYLWELKIDLHVLKNAKYAVVEVVWWYKAYLCVDEYEIYKNAGLYTGEIIGRIIRQLCYRGVYYSAVIKTHVELRNTESFEAE